MSRKSSIRERLYLILGVILLSTFGIFTSFGSYLFWNGWLNPEVMVQLISSCVATLVLVAILGLRMISDALNRYEKSTVPRIKSLQQLIRQLQSRISFYDSTQIIDEVDKIKKATTYIEQFQNFFFTKLYPSGSLKRLDGLTPMINHIIKSLNELLSAWPFEYEYYSSQYLKAILTEDEQEREQRIEELDNHYHHETDVKSLIEKVLVERKELTENTRNLKDGVNKQLDEIEEELDNFLQSN